MAQKKNPLLNDIVQPTAFVVGISECGTDTCSMHYKGRNEGSEAASLIAQVISRVATDMCGPENAPTLKYAVACKLLRSIKRGRKPKDGGWTPKQFIKDIEAGTEPSISLKKEPA